MSSIDTVKLRASIDELQQKLNEKYLLCKAGELPYYQFLNEEYRIKSSMLTRIVMAKAGTDVIFYNYKNKLRSAKIKGSEYNHKTKTYSLIIESVKTGTTYTVKWHDFEKLFITTDKKLDIGKAVMKYIAPVYMFNSKTDFSDAEK